MREAAMTVGAAGQIRIGQGVDEADDAVGWQGSGEQPARYLFRNIVVMSRGCLRR